ncbi:MAG: hypothetical protein MUF75_05490 [Bacteroidia bacterium]|jgi:hypothetical protein|nr:hypothetical protein [Bacteroidia bacterium]
MAKKNVKKTVVKLKKGAKALPSKKAGKKPPVKKKTVKKKATKSKRGNDSVDLECFLSTACIQHKQLPDNCTELQLLRKFRDDFMKPSPTGEALVNHYYKIGPELVKAIEKDKNKKRTYAFIFSCIQNACEKIRLQQNSKAQMVYVKMVKRLMHKYQTA